MERIVSWTGCECMKHLYRETVPLKTNKKTQNDAKTEFFFLQMVEPLLCPSHFNFINTGHALVIAIQSQQVRSIKNIHDVTYGRRGGGGWRMTRILY